MRVAVGRPSARAGLVAVAVAALAVLAATLRLRALSAPYWIDEGISVGIAATPPERHPGGAARGRLAAAVLPAAARLDGVLRLVAERRRTRSPPLGHRVRAGRVVGGGALRHVGRPRRRRTDGARPLHRPLRRRDADVLAPAPAGRARVRRVPARLRAAPARTRGDLRAAPRAVAVLARVGRVPRPGRGAGLARARRRRPAPRRALVRDGVLAFGGAALLFAPWVPTLLYQAAHTGAPWSHRPTGRSLERAISPGLERSARRAPAPSGRCRGARDRGVAQRPPRAPRAAGDGGHRSGDTARGLRLLALRDARMGPALPGRGARAARAAGRLGARPPRAPRPAGRARGGPLRLARPAHRRDALAQEQRRARRPRARARAAARRRSSSPPSPSRCPSSRTSCPPACATRRRWGRSPMPASWTGATR